MGISAWPRGSSRLDETNEDLHRQKNTVEGQKQRITEEHDKLDRANKALIVSENATEYNFFAAQEAAEDLLRLARQPKFLSGDEQFRRALLRQATEMCRRFAVLKETDEPQPLAMYRSARAARLVGDLEAALGETASAVRNHEQALGTFNKLLALVQAAKVRPIRGADYEREILESQVQLWSVLEQLGSPKAGPLLASTLARFGELNSSRRAQPEYRRLEGTLLGQRGVHHQRRGQVQLALRDYDRAIELLGSLPGQEECQLEALAARPELAKDLKVSLRYAAASYAARAGIGQGEDAANLSEQERSRWRKKAVEWLGADLAIRAKMLADSKPKDRAKVAATISNWQEDSDLASLRDPVEVAKLPADEQQACKKLWSDVDALLKKAQEKAK